MNKAEHKHEWREGWYGWECECGAFIAFGCEPWIPTNQEIHEMLLAGRQGEGDKIDGLRTLYHRYGG